MHSDTILLCSVQPARFSEIECEKSVPVDAYFKKIFKQAKLFPCPPCHDATG